MEPFTFDTDAQRLLATLKNAHKHGVANISFHPRNADDNFVCGRDKHLGLKNGTK